MDELIPTGEQQAVLDTAQNSRDNLLITALAGAAKTTTLQLLAEGPLKREMVLSLAFNSAIAKEMGKVLPSNCESRTFNSLGHRAWAKQLGVKPNKLRLNAKKTLDLLSAFINELEGEQHEEMSENFIPVLQAINRLKAFGFMPNSPTWGQTLSVVQPHQFESICGRRLSPIEMSAIIEVSVHSASRALDGEIDFADQLLLPVAFDLRLPQSAVTLVDEAQDMSELNHLLLARTVGSDRLIAVGDEHQAIYAFRGANRDSMDLLASRFSMRKMSLTTSFRCARLIVAEARWRAPEMQAPEWALGGKVSFPDQWSADLIPDGAMVLCRNNAPLIGLAMKFLREGRRPTLRGVDILESLANIIRKTTTLHDLPADDLHLRIEKWISRDFVKTRQSRTAKDRAESLRLLTKDRTLRQALRHIRSLMDMQGKINFSTVHKAKGLEAEQVFILDQFLFDIGSGDEDNQDDNLLYVAQTRAKHGLTYVQSLNFQEKETPS